jgi:hypothetical protein
MLPDNMKIRVFRRRFALGLAVLVLGGVAVYGQMPGAAGPAGMSAALTKLFGNTTAFTAKGEMQVTDNTQKEVAYWPMDFALLDRKLRVEIDLTQTKDMPASAAATLKKIGMAEVISIIRPDKKLVYVIYPDQRVMLTMPLPKEDYEGSDKAPKLSKTELGKETIDGHPCVKNRVVITDSAGQTVEAVTWDATDLKDLPIQIQTQEKDSTSLVRFKQIQFARPAVGLFEPPSGFTQYDNAEELKMGVMKKMMDTATKK